MYNEKRALKLWYKKIYASDEYEATILSRYDEAELLHDVLQYFIDNAKSPAQKKMKLKILCDYYELKKQSFLHEYQILKEKAVYFEKHSK